MTTQVFLWCKDCLLCRAALMLTFSRLSVVDMSASLQVWRHAAGVMHLLVGSSGVLPCQLNIWSVATCKKPFGFTAVHSVPCSQAYKLHLKCVPYTHLFESSGTPIYTPCVLYSDFPIYIFCTPTSNCYISEPQQSEHNDQKLLVFWIFLLAGRAYIYNRLDTHFTCVEPCVVDLFFLRWKILIAHWNVTFLSSLENQDCGSEGKAIICECYCRHISFPSSTNW